MLTGNLLRLADVAALLQTGEGFARGWLKRNSVPTVDLGLGRGGGLRWRMSDISDAIDLAAKGPEAKPSRPSVPQRFITGRSMAEIKATLTQGPASH